MTVGNELIRNDYTGDGVATAFTFNFRVMVKADLQVYVAGVLKTLVTDYDLTGVDNPAGGTVTFVVAPANLATVVLIRHMDLHQPIDYTVGEKFPAETHERAIDRATLQKQQVDEEVKRSLRIGLHASPGTTDTVITDTPAARADKLLAFSADGLAILPRGNVSNLEDVDAALVEAAASAAAALVSEQNADASEAAAAGFAANADASAVDAAASAAEAATELPQNSQSADYTAVLEDAGGHIFHPVADDNPRTFTIPANASVPFPLGTTITFVNRINVLTLAITTDTLIAAGTGATGSRTLAAAGLATAIKIAPTVWMIGGSGLDTTPAILKAIVDAKGDLIAGTAADTPARVAVGANRTILEADSALTPGVGWVDRALGLKSVQVFTADGTWTKPAGIRKIVVEVVGGGGGGGGTAASAGESAAGGGGGGYAKKLIDVSAVATSAITVGAAGTAGGADANGGAGEDSVYADGVTTVTGAGGGLGAVDPAAGGAGGTATGGNVNIPGGAGGPSLAALATLSINRGGNSQLGQGAIAPVNGNGIVGGVHGGGGSGGHSGTAATKTGGAGAAGIVIVYEYE